jgi:phosphoribosylanthranilate isomerase
MLSRHHGAVRRSSRLSPLIVKICGLSTLGALEAAIDAGADMAGFVFFEKSPRHIDLAAAETLGRIAAGHIRKVALTVNASDETLDAVVAALDPDILQLHGEETPERLRDVKARFGLPIIKALGVATSEDVAASQSYVDVADMILFDAKPVASAAVPGGAGVAFDWTLLAGKTPENWMLAGGLTAGTVAEAIRLTQAPAVDVSSGVERARGVKDEDKIRAFVAAARGG